MQRATRSLDQQLGGASGDWRHRVLHFHLPIALASAVILFLWMSLPLFQAAGHQGPPQGTVQTPDHQVPSQGAVQPPSHQGSPRANTQPSDHSSPSHANGRPSEHQGQMQGDGGPLSTDQSADQNRASMARFTTATGYIALGLLGLTLLVGPANLLLRRRTPISSYLTRDVGMWAAIVSVVHVIVGFQVHGPTVPLVERISYYFFAPNGRPLINAFGMGNWTGLAATVIVVGLLAISNDLALRKLQARNWKKLQRLNYALFALVIAHAILYGALLRVTSISTILLGLIVIAVLSGQMVGVWLWRRRHSEIGARLT